jgi:hypothetical protein
MESAIVSCSDVKSTSPQMLLICIVFLLLSKDYTARLVAS